MEQIPEEITLCKLECVLMPQGEVLCEGKTIGWFSNMQPYLKKADDSLLLDACKRVRCWLNDEHKEKLNKVSCEQILHDAIAAEEKK